MLGKDKQKAISLDIFVNYCKTLDVGFTIEYKLGDIINPDGTIDCGGTGYRISVGNLVHHRNNREVIFPTVADALKAGYDLARKIDRYGQQRYTSLVQ